MSVSDAVGHGFTPLSGHTKDYLMLLIASLLSTQTLEYGFGSAAWLCKGRVVFGTVYQDMHFKDLLGSNARVGYCIPVMDFYLVRHGF